MGLLDEFSAFAKTPEGQGLLSAAFGGMATARRGQPINSLGKAGLAGMMGYGSALDRNERSAENALTNQLRQIQMGDLQRKQMQAKQMEEFVATLSPEKQQALRMGVPAEKLWERENPVIAPYTLTPGSKRYGQDNQLIAEVPSDKTTTMSSLGKLQAELDALPPGHPSRRVYEQAIRKETTFAPPISIQNYPNPVSIIGPDGKPQLAQFGNKGDVRYTGLTQAPEAKPPTESEAKAAFYAQNMKAASRTISQLEKEGMNMSAIGTQAGNALAGGRLNVTASPRSQQAVQAQKQWSEQMLRMQTGAAATQDEIVRTVATYFPQIGDSKEVVDQKREMRTQAENGVFAAAGRAAGRVQEPNQPSPDAKGKTIVRTGRSNGKKVVEYSDGSIEYAN